MKTKNIVSSLKNKVDKVHDVLSFSIPEHKVVNYKNPQGNNFNHIKRDNHASLYIGKMFHHDENIYNEDTVKGMLHYAGQRLTSPDDKIQLQVAGDVYDLFADEEGNDQKPLSAEEQDLLLQKIISQDKTLKNRVSLINIADRHPELIDGLRRGGMASLIDEDMGDLPAKNDTFTSRDIAAYLYQLCIDYPAVKNLFLSTVPEKLKNDKNNRFYYALVETAIRIYDFLDGITLQGGVERQNVYDQLVMFFSGQSTENIPAKLLGIPAINELQAWCREKAGDQEMSRWHFKNKTFLSLLPKEEEKETMQRKIKHIIGITALTIAGVLGGSSITYNLMHNAEQKKYKEKQAEILKQKLKYEKLGVGFHFNMDYKNYESDEKKVELVENTTNSIYSYILKRYTVDPSEEKALRGIIQNELLKKSEFSKDIAINTVNIDMDQASRFAYHFIEDNLIKNNAISLQSIGFDIRPYSNRLKEKRLFENTASTTDTFVLDAKGFITVNNTTDHFVYAGKPASISHLGTFTSKSYDQEFDLIKVILDKASNMNPYHYELILAKNHYDPSNIYSSKIGKTVTKELLELREQKKEQK